MNIVCIAGNLTRDPELRNTQSGKQVVNFSLAINEGKDKTEFVNCVAWEKSAELINQYVKKGDRLSCSGRLQTTKWQDQQGQDKYKTEVVVTQFDFPPKRASDEGRMSEEEANDMMHAHALAVTRAAAQQRRSAQDMDDEIPF